MTFFSMAMVVGALAGAFVAQEADGASVVANEPENLGLDYSLDTAFTNDDNGAVYNTATSDITSTLFNQIFALGNSGESSVEDMIDNELGLNIRGVPAGEVDGGWSVVGNGSSLDYSNNGVILAGSPAYDVWEATQQNAAQDTLATRVTVPNSLLDINTISGYQAFTFADTASQGWDPADYDPIVVLTGTSEANDLFSASNYNGTVPSATISDGFVGTQDILNSWSEDTPQYALVHPNDFGVIPEPSTTALLGLGFAGAALYRRREGRLGTHPTHI